MGQGSIRCQEAVGDRLFSPAPPFRLPHGLCVGVPLPGGAGEVPEEAWARLLPEERSFARGLPARRRSSWVGGRLALRAALDALGVRCGPLLATERGATALPPEVAGSLSHKAGLLAVALAERADGASRGVDLEALRPGAESLADWVLAAEERERLEALAPAERGRDVVVCFSLKEAVVKALDPYLGRLAGLGEVRVGPRPDGSAVIDLRLRPGEGPFAVDARWLVLRPGLILTSVCARPLTR